MSAYWRPVGVVAKERSDGEAFAMQGISSDGATARNARL